MLSFFRTKAFKWVAILTLVLVFIGFFRSFTAQFFPTPDTYRIARDRSWTGLGMWGNDKQLLGFSDELLVAIARQQGFYLELVNVSPRTILEGLEDENYDAIISWMAPDTLTKQVYTFSHPFYLLTPILVVQEHAQYDSLNDLAGRSVAILQDSQALNHHHHLPAVNWFPYHNAAISLDDLVRNRVDGVVLDLFSAYAFASGVYKGSIRIIPAVITDEAIRVVSTRDGQGEDLIPLINQGLEELKINGAYQKLLKKWGLENINQ